MQNLLLFWIGLATYLCLFHNILHTKIRMSTYHFLSFLFIITVWSVYDYTTEAPNPETFCILVIILIIMQEKWYFNLCWAIIFTLGINIISNIVGYLFFFITRISPTANIDPYLALAFPVEITIIIISFYINKKEHLSRDFIQHITWRGYVLLSFVTLVDFILSSLSSLLIDGDPLGKLLSHILLAAIFIMILMSIALLILYFRLQHYHSLLQQTNAIQQNLLDLETQHYQDLQQKTLDLRAFRHDYNYHITAMQGLVAQNDWTGLQQYITSLSQIKEQVYYLSTNHPVADAIINYFYERISDHTEFQVNGKLSEKIFLNDTDLCIILSNLLRNATEAQENLPASDTRNIHISLYANEQYILIQIENASKPYDSHKLTNLPTTKTNAANHGFGLSNVQKVVHKYDGKLDLLYENGIFTASAYLRNT
ncbi:MAG: GHKL domain-containing protein [Lachnospiraceae bacterium]|nr:GHKL domain-containing protein [Lachnospiraceae bacterium]